MKAETIVRKWGNSLGIILPKEIVRRIGLRAREEVIVSIRKNRMS